MANYGNYSIFSFILILNIILLSFSGHALGGRDIPNKSTKMSDKKQPDSFIEYDGTVLIPGFGRVVVPPKGSHFNPFTYNPVTGTNTGTGLIIPNPGVEVPAAPGSTTGGSIDVPPSRH
ncbi:hypothetical protein A4A49_20135 [Nicotiana attenuata]|uniref:Cell wall protein n=1 Tax=Nicotiana attenuata TaxID=49451 RepID=A0A314KTK6_NICAT|nr:hypothetical protein A4A49_20135 [Nicotiana attenuata]